MEVPETIQERLGSQGAGAWKSGYKSGKLDGAKVAKDPIATKLNSIANQVVSAKKKEDYKPPTVDDLASMATVMFARGKPEADANGVARLLTFASRVYDAMPPVPTKPKTDKPKPASP